MQCMAFEQSCIMAGPESTASSDLEALHEALHSAAPSLQHSKTIPSPTLAQIFPMTDEIESVAYSK